MSRMFLRGGRILPGPLKVLDEAERRSPVPMAPIALTSAFLAAGLLLMPQLSHRPSVDPEPMVALAEAGTPVPEARTSATSTLFVAATPTQAEPVVTSARAEVVSAAPTASHPAPPAPAKRAAASAKSAAVRSLFQLDLLPVLQAGEEDLDTGAPAPPKASPNPPQRRTAAAGRGPAVAATDGSTRHRGDPAGWLRCLRRAPSTVIRGAATQPRTH